MIETSKQETELLRRVRDICHHMGCTSRLDVLLPLILDAAIEISRAERGFLVRVEGSGQAAAELPLKVEGARGFGQVDLSLVEHAASRTVVRRVMDTGEGVVTRSDRERLLLEASSVEGAGVRSIVGVPLLLRGEIRGALYLDHKTQENAFTEGHIALLQPFANQAALALETADLRAAEDETTARAESGRLPSISRYGRLVGGSAGMREVYEEVERATRTWDPVLILGESGAQKELVAREIHARGNFSEDPFLKVNCGAVPPEQLEEDLFGGGGRDGLFLQVANGTVFLDAVEETSAQVQGQLLDLLQNRRFRPMRSKDYRHTPCRLMAAANPDLRARVEAKSFREDLYYRLDVMRIVLPPLRQHPEDIEFLIAQQAAEAKRAIELTEGALECLRSYPWPGNERELDNEVRRILAQGQTKITERDLSAEIREQRRPAGPQLAFTGRTLAEMERAMVENALKECGGNKARAARALGVPRSTLYGLLERHGLA